MRDPELQLAGFVTYMDLWNQVDLEYRRTPEWRVIRKQRLLNQLHRLTKNYERAFTKWLENSNSQ